MEDYKPYSVRFFRSKVSTKYLAKGQKIFIRDLVKEKDGILLCLCVFRVKGKRRWIIREIKTDEFGILMDVGEKFWNHVHLNKIGGVIGWFRNKTDSQIVEEYFK